MLFCSLEFLFSDFPSVHCVASQKICFFLLFFPQTLIPFYQDSKLSAQDLSLMQRNIKNEKSDTEH